MEAISKLHRRGSELHRLICKDSVISRSSDLNSDPSITRISSSDLEKISVRFLRVLSNKEGESSLSESKWLEHDESLAVWVKGVPYPALQRREKPRHVDLYFSSWVIKPESLGGNAKLAMVCAISPVQSCKSETLSTLRFAQRAKAIKNRAVVNEEMETKLTLTEVIQQGGMPVEA